MLFTPDGDRTTPRSRRSGFKALRVRDTDSYGAPMRQTFFKAGEVILELIGPEEPAADGSADGPAGFFGLALTVADLDATAALLGDGAGRAQGRRAARSPHRHAAPPRPRACRWPSP